MIWQEISVLFLPHSEMIRFLLREKNMTSQEILSEISLFVKNPLVLRAMVSMSFGAIPGPLQFFAHCFNNISVQFSSVQSLSSVRLFATPWIAACQTFLFITNSRSSLKLTSIESVMPSSHLILCCPLFLLPLIPPSVRGFSNELTLLNTGVQKHTEVLPMDSQGLSWFTSIPLLLLSHFSRVWLCVTP